MVDADRLLETRFAHVVAVALATVGVAAIAGGAAGSFWFWLFYLLLWAEFLDQFDEGSRLAALLSGSDDEETVEVDADDVDEEDPLAVLRTRYARGEIDDAEFEARLERLLETDPADPSGGTTSERDRNRDADVDYA